MNQKKLLFIIFIFSIILIILYFTTSLYENFRVIDITTKGQPIGPDGINPQGQGQGQGPPIGPGGIKPQEQYPTQNQIYIQLDLVKYTFMLFFIIILLIILFKK
jgi:hypothetical protein